MLGLLLCGVLWAQERGTAKAVSADAQSPGEVYDGGRWALVIGVNNYRDQGLVDLQFAVNDATRVAETLREMGSYEADHLVLMVSGHPDPHLRPTRANILEQLALLEQRAQGAEQVMVYFSGHGLGAAAPDGQRHNYLLPLDTKMAVPEETAVDLDYLVSRVDSIEAQQRLVVVDACRNERDRGVKSATPTQTLVDPRLGASSGTRQVFSAEFGAVSYEEPRWEMGAFTWYWVQGMECAADGAITGVRDGVVTVEEVYRYTRDALALSPTGRVQVPTLAGESTGDFPLTRARGECGRVPPRPRIWAYPDFRRTLWRGALTGAAVAGTGWTYATWFELNGRPEQNLVRMGHYTLAVGTVGLGVAAGVSAVRLGVEYGGDLRSWSRLKGASSGPMVWSPALGPVAPGVWGAGVTVRW